MRIPFADFGAFIVPEGYSDEQVLFLSDIFPTGYMAAENCDIKKGQTIAVWGCGPVGLFSIMSAFVLGAGRVIAVESVEERKDLARSLGAEVIDFKDGRWLRESCDVSERHQCGKNEKPTSNTAATA